MGWRERFSFSTRIGIRPMKRPSKPSALRFESMSDSAIRKRRLRRRKQIANGALWVFCAAVFLVVLYALIMLVMDLIERACAPTPIL